MQDDAIYRCINQACARAMPRPVKFCPYCGTAQTADARAQAAAPAPDASVSAAVAGAEAAAALSGWSDAPLDQPAQAASQPPVDVTKPSAPTSAATRREIPVGGWSPGAPDDPAPHAFGHSAGKAAPPQRERGIPWPPQPSKPPSAPPGRKPIRLRWWIVLLVALWGLFLWAKPSARKNEKRIDAAIALAQDCKGKEAQDELIALRASHATAPQLERLQRGLNDASASCTRKRQREKAWTDASGAVDAQLAAGAIERARTRLQAFVKRWGDDDATRALKGRIDAARADHPLAVPPADAATAQSARNLLQEARADLARGDARAARDKMDLCLTMVDPADRDCAALKARAERTIGTE